MRNAMRPSLASMSSLLLLLAVACGNQGDTADTFQHREGLSAEPPAHSLYAHVPTVVASPVSREAKIAWEGALARHGLSNSGGIALAPLGGARVSAFRELGLDGLVSVDWSLMGSVVGIAAAFENDRNTLKEVVQAGLNGSMATIDVMRAPLAAQILARLALELDVHDVTLSYYATPEEGPVCTAVWDSPPLRIQTRPPWQITHFAFEWQGRSRELLVLHWYGTTPLPIKLLRDMVPQGFAWSYVSADYLAYFSEASDGQHWRCAEDRTQKMFDLLGVHASVLLDYPVNGAVNFGCNRMDLRDHGFNLVMSYKVPPIDENVFGYSGHVEGDEVRAYRRGDTAPMTQRHLKLTGLLLVQRSRVHLL